MGKITNNDPKIQEPFLPQLHASFFLLYFAFCLTCTNNNLPEELSLYLPAPQTSFLKSGKVPSTLELHKKKTSSKNKVINVKFLFYFFVFTNSKETSYQMKLEAVEITISTI